VFATGSVSGWQLNATNYFGFRFNTAAGMRYAFGTMQVGATAADRTLLSVSYEDSGGSITVPAPGALALLGAAGMLGGRRRRS
jgi:MYXO-CTERM domain-containing protein